jgi:ABC-type uncharacterized transport system auxiliary subunit
MKLILLLAVLALAPLLAACTPASPPTPGFTLSLSVKWHKYTNICWA